MADDIRAKASNSLNSVRSTSADASNDPEIWVGSSSKYIGSGLTRQKEVIPLSQMQQKLLSSGAQRLPGYTQVVNQLVSSNFMTKSAAKYPGGAAAGLANAADVYQAYATEGGTMNFTQWLDWYSSTSEPSADGRGGRGGYSGPTTTTSVTLTDEVTAEALLDKFSRDMLGRGLTKKETDKYIKQFRKAEMESPQVTTTTPGRGTATQVTETAANKEEMLRQLLIKNPDYEKYQFDTNIMDILIEDIEEGKKVIYG